MFLQKFCFRSEVGHIQMNLTYKEVKQRIVVFQISGPKFGTNNDASWWVEHDDKEAEEEDEKEEEEEEALLTS